MRVTEMGASEGCPCRFKGVSESAMTKRPEPPCALGGLPLGTGTRTYTNLSRRQDIFGPHGASLLPKKFRESRYFRLKILSILSNSRSSNRPRIGPRALFEPTILSKVKSKPKSGLGCLPVPQSEQKPDCTQLTPSLTFRRQNRQSVWHPTRSRISNTTENRTRIA